MTTEQQEQKQEQHTWNSLARHRIYPVTEGIQSKQTEVVYERCFNHFLDHIRIHDPQVLLDFSPKVIKQMVIDYVLHLRDEKRLSRTSIKVHLSAILRFFQINNDDFNLTIRSFKLHMPSDDSVEDDRPYTAEEIAQVIRDSDLRSKVAILLLCSTGMRIGALDSVRMCDLTEMPFQNAILYKVQVYARTNDKYYTFCTPESYSVIQEYLNYRKRYGENIKNKSPLIREQFNKDDKIRVQYPKFVSKRAIEYMITHALESSGVRKPGEIDREVHLSHGFRKFFMTQCEKSGMKSINVKMLLGHDIGVSGHYYRPAESDILEDFMLHAADTLTIDPKHRLEKENQELKSERAEELERLKARLREYEKFANKTAEEINELKSSMKLAGYEYAISRGGPTLTNIVNAANDLMTKIGKVPNVGKVTPAERALYLEKLRYFKLKLEEAKTPDEVQFENPHPGEWYEWPKDKQIKELDSMIKKLSAKAN